MAIPKKKFRLADTAQQMVGAIILSGPFIVTEEVWRIAFNMNWIQFFLVLAIGGSIGYFALFKADKTRDATTEQNVAGVPVRFISLLAVAYFSVLLIILVIGAHTTFLADFETLLHTLGICGLFSIVGAATADSVF
ncbi:MAG: DUF2391 family protein [Candidatus Kariarchaeaceae archaeon]|jgi:uncharacterized membrane protein